MDWKGDEDKRARFLGQLLGVAEAATLFAYAVGFNLSDFNFANRVFRIADFYGGRHPLIGPFSYSAQLCKLRVDMWAENEGYSNVAHVFERDDNWQGALEEYLRLRRPREEWFFFPKVRKDGSRVRVLELAGPCRIRVPPPQPCVARSCCG